MLHQRDGKRSGSDRVSARTSRDHAHEAAGRYRSLSRSALALTRKSYGKVDKELAGPRGAEE